jgi:Fe-S-cluster containining protein
MSQLMKLKVIPTAEGSQDKPWFADGLNFTCTQCGNCCTGAPGYVWISDEEISRLAEYLKLTTDQVIERYCRKIGGRLSLKEHRSPAGQYDCIFLQEIKVPGGKNRPPQLKRICTVYSVRPLQCRTWPFWDGLLASKQNWESAKARCPGIDAGARHFTRKQIESLRDAQDWPDRPPTSKPTPPSKIPPAPKSRPPKPAPKRK